MIAVVLYIGPVEIPGADDHEGYVAGLTRDGGWTGIWSDPRSSPVEYYAPACECGWHGAPVHPAGPDGYRAAQRTWLDDHFACLAVTGPAVTALGRALCVDSDFLTPS